MTSEERRNDYDNVPGHGAILDDGTWWTNCLATVGEICTTQYYYREIMNGVFWASDKRSQCVETAVFCGKSFARWKNLEPTEFKPCHYYKNQSLKYK